MSNKLLFLLLCMSTVLLQAGQEYRPLFENKTILITGGAGFIGKALVKAILLYHPKKVIIFSRDEFKHSKLLEELKGQPVSSIIGDVRDYDAIYKATQGVDIVIHAAALKRIDMMEYHIRESIRTNILGSLNVVKACTENKVKKALLVSTDKACSPINTYGACKFIAEKLFTNFGAQSKDTVCLAVRYGNVLQSTGSVIPFFYQRISEGKTIPLTDVNMTRFFITKQQALEHIFKALLYGNNGEIFIPMLPAFKIVDLIDVLQEFLNSRCPVELVGLRPGEKLHESMINPSEALYTHRYKDMFVIMPNIPVQAIDAVVSQDDVSSTFDLSEYSSQWSVLEKSELIDLIKQCDLFI